MLLPRRPASRNVRCIITFKARTISSLRIWRRATNRTSPCSNVGLRKPTVALRRRFAQFSLTLRRRPGIQSGKDVASFGLQRNWPTCPVIQRSRLVLRIRRGSRIGYPRPSRRRAWRTRRHSRGKSCCCWMDRSLWYSCIATPPIWKLRAMPHSRSSAPPPVPGGDPQIRKGENVQVKKYGCDAIQPDRIALCCYGFVSAVSAALRRWLVAPSARRSLRLQERLAPAASGRVRGPAPSSQSGRSRSASR